MNHRRPPAAAIIDPVTAPVTDPEPNGSLSPAVGVVADEIAAQVAEALAILDRHFAGTLRAVHLFGSAVDGGLKPFSDIDLLVTVGEAPDESLRRSVLLELLDASAPSPLPQATRAPLRRRPLEVTVVAVDQIVPWRHPARRELQFGEWLRDDLLAGIFEGSGPDPDLAVLLTQARQHSIALLGPPAAAHFEAVPDRDLIGAFGDALALWRSGPDWHGDERNVVLTLARIDYSLTTGRITTKDRAADQMLTWLPDPRRAVLRDARLAYLGEADDDLSTRPEEVDAFIAAVVPRLTAMVAASQGQR